MAVVLVYVLVSAVLATKHMQVRNGVLRSQMLRQVIPRGLLVLVEQCRHRVAKVVSEISNKRGLDAMVVPC